MPEFHWPGGEWMTAGMLVYVALLFQAAGFLTRDELWLRLLVVAGSFIYIAYYFWYPAEPLWGAIFASGLLTAINCVLIVVIVRERTLLAMSQRDAALFKQFGRFSPGQFRRIMKLANWHPAGKAMRLTTQGEVPDRLFYVTGGSLSIEKGNGPVRREAETFIGEIAFLYGSPASATVETGPQAQVISWPATELRRLMRRHPNLENAMIATLSEDMARKVATSQPLERQAEKPGPQPFMSPLETGSPLP